MSEDSKTNGNTAETTWFGMDRLRLSDGEQAIEVTIGSESHWDRSHLRKLRQSGDLPGIVPIIDSDFSADGKPFAVTPVVEAPTLAELAERDELDWSQAAGIAEAAARAANEAHERGLFHGGLCPADIHVIGDDVAIGGIGLGLGGVPAADRGAWVAPEVRDGLEPTKRSDVYSLGKVLETSLGDALDSVPRSIRRLIMWSSSDTPEARPPSAIEFASILAEGLGEDRRTYGPAFIPTAEASDLAAQASSAVSNHVPSDTARQTATSGTAVAGIAGAGAVAGLAAGAGQLFGKDDDAEAELDPATVLDSATKGVHADGFSINDADVTAELPKGVEVDEPEELILELEEEPEEPIVADYSADLSSEASATPGTETKKVASFDYSTVDKTPQEATPERRSRVPMAIGALLLLGLAGIAWGLLSSGDDEPTATAGGTTVSTPAADGADDEAATATTAGDDEATASSTEGAEPAAGGTSEDGTDGDPATPPTSAETESSTPTSAAGATSDDEDDGSSSSASDETEPSPPTTATTATESEAGSDTDTATETDAAEDEPAVAEPVAMADGPIAVDQAGIQLLHGVPDVDVDIYVDGKAVATGFSTGTIAGPMTMGSGDAEVAVFAAMDNPPASIDDRSDDPVGSDTVTLGDSATSIVAHLDADGNLALSEFAENLETTDPGKGRIQVRHLAAAGAVDVEVAGDVIGTVEAGDAASLQVPAGAVDVRILGEDGSVVTSANVTVGDGEFASLSVIGAPDDDTTQIVIQSYTGLATAPAAVPTGDSGLLGAGENQTGLRVLFGLMGAMFLGGVAVTVGRRRSLS